MDNVTKKHLEEESEDGVKNENIEIVRKMFENNQSMLSSKVLKRLIDDNVLSNEEVNGLINEGEGMRKCKWCGKFFKDTDDFCSPDCLEKFMVEALKKK